MKRDKAAVRSSAKKVEVFGGPSLMTRNKSSFRMAG